MEQTSGAALATILLSGLAATVIGTLLLYSPARASAWLKPMGSGPAHPPERTRNYSRVILACGIAWLLVFTGEVVPFEHARPFAVVALSTLLLPLATLGFVVTIFLAFRPRG